MDNQELEKQVKQISEKMTDSEAIDFAVNLYFGKTFKFRDNQRDTILDILDFYNESPDGLYLLDAPTGSGKSIIAMIVSAVLSIRKKTGYILASDLSLQDQYEKDLEYNFPYWGSIKGVNNYHCDVNHEKYNLGDCKIKGLNSFQTAELPCFKTCGYLSNRLKAKDSSVSLLNYSYWLIQRNYVAASMESGQEPFKKRDFSICDEGHKITEIVQNHFSPTITDKTRPNLVELKRSVKEEYNIDINVDLDKLKIVMTSLYSEENTEKLEFLMSEFTDYLWQFVKKLDEVSEYNKKAFKGESIPRSKFKVMRKLDSVKDIHCKFEDYIHIIKDIGHSAIIKNPGNEKIVFNCIDESYMMQKHFHKQSKFRLIMTATMGDHKKFMKLIDGDFDNYRYRRMKSSFNYDRSPIYLYNKRRMSYHEKENTIPWLCEQVEKVLTLHSEERGIIHTGSYEIARIIYDMIDKSHHGRILVYSDSEEKKKILLEHKDSKNTVLMGPSLLEGIDLKGDLARFQIMAKVPYPSLADRFVKAKLKIAQDWYNWKSSVGILQGVGRAVRSKDDWATTYFLDACLADLISKNRSAFPDEFIGRIKIVKV